MKNARSLPARAVRRFRARHRVALTGTPVENRLAELWAIMDVLNPGILGTAERFRTRFAIPVERHGEHRRRGAAAPHHPPLPAAPAQDRSDDRRRPPRQDRDHPALPAHPRAGVALPHDRRRHAGEDRRLHRHRPPWQRAGGDDQAQAGVRPPGAAAARRLADRAPLRQGRAAGGDPRRGRSPRATARCASPSSPSSGTCSCRTCRPGSTRTSPSCTAVSPGGAARRSSSASRQRRPGPAGPAGLAQGGRHRPHADGRDARRAPRPLVEPRRRAAGDGPRLPDRAAPDRAGPHVLLPRHRGGADRRADPLQARALRAGGRRRRGLADGAVHRHAARAVRPQRRRAPGRRSGQGRRGRGRQRRARAGRG